MSAHSFVSHQRSVCDIIHRSEWAHNIYDVLVFVYFIFLEIQYCELQNTQVPGRVQSFRTFPFVKGQEKRESACQEDHQSVR
jgi:hypothetical protein